MTFPTIDVPTLPPPEGAEDKRARAVRLHCDHEAALDQLDAEIRTRPRHTVLVERSRVLSCLRRDPEAIADAEAAIAYEPRESDGYESLMHTVTFAPEPDVRHAFEVVARARRAVVGRPGPMCHVEAWYAYALASAGVVGHARRVVRAQADALPFDMDVCGLAVLVEMKAGRPWAALSYAAPDMRHVDKTKFARGAAARIFADLAGLGGLSMFVGIGPRAVDPSADPRFVAVMLLAFGAASFVWLLRALAVLGRLLSTLPGAAGATYAAAVLVAQSYAVEHPDRLRNPGFVLTWCLLAAVGVGAGLWSVGHRVRRAFERAGLRKRHRADIGAAMAAERTSTAPPLVLLHPVTTPAPGALLLSGLAPASPARDGIWAALATAPVDLLVRTDQPAERPAAAPPGTAEIVAFPIARGRPPSEPEVDTLVASVLVRLARGQRVVLACDTGAESSAVVAAAVCVRLGLDPAAAWAHVATCRGVRPLVSDEQREWLDRFAVRPVRTAGR